ncbi:MAG TPA: molybdopterin molybdotransferase MoeA, partial [Armatimonadetes bacterium]|nr:molybdopterin molybdotransferase MoeA [Armatimonadota bacterium]
MRRVGGKFRLFQQVTEFEDALRMVCESIAPIQRTEELPLADACGRVLAEDIHAKVDMPPFNRAAMDGYAVVATSTAGATPSHPKRLRVIGVVYAGDDVKQLRISPETCVEIATGAEVPIGADAVVMAEETQRISADEVLIFAEVEPGCNMSQRGYDKRAGEQLLSKGDVLTPGRIALLAAAGIDTVRVYAKPRVGIIPTGSEIVIPGEPLSPGKIYDSNSYMLCALLIQHGCEPARLDIVGDQLEAIKQVFNDALFADHDMLLITGGSSVGERDYVADLVHGIGELKFHGLNTRPGKPTLFALINGKPIIGMPGHPVSCFVIANALIVPALHKLAGERDYQPVRVRGELTRTVEMPRDVHHFVIVHVFDGKVEPVFRYADAISTLRFADGYITLPVGVECIEEGTEVEVTL